MISKKGKKMKKLFFVMICIFMLLFLWAIIVARGSEVNQGNQNPVPVYNQNGGLQNTEDYPYVERLANVKNECPVSSNCAIPVEPTRMVSCGNVMPPESRIPGDNCEP